MSEDNMLKTITFKIYPNDAQIQSLNRWLDACCRIYNRSLEHRIKAYKRRRQSINYYKQQGMLTEWRSRIESIRLVPVFFSRDALRRVDRGFKAFFRRVKAGEKPGFPRFRSHRRYNSLECLVPSRYADGRSIRVPNLGRIRSRGPKVPEGQQRLLRIIRRASEWFAQVVIDDEKQPPTTKPVQESVGIDVGLTTFATLSTGERIENPRYARASTRKLRSAQRRVSRRVKRSRNRRKAVVRLQRVHERIKSQRRSFAHSEARRLVYRFDFIAVEKLNVRGLAGGMLAKSVHDAGWGIFLNILRVKAESAGRTVVEVNPSGTSQTCPSCGAIKRKELSERVHACPCGVVLDRDHASAQVILARALVATGAIAPVEESAPTRNICAAQVDPVKQEDQMTLWSVK